MYHSIKTTLYHGTISEIQRVDVKYGQGRKDFGKGFYMAVSKKQAIQMMHKKYKEAVKRNKEKQEVIFTERLYEITLEQKFLKQQIQNGLTLY